MDNQCLGIFTYGGSNLQFRLCDTSVALQPAANDNGHYDCVFERAGAFIDSPPNPPSPLK
mgnify:CR=1 FL=1